MQKILSNQKIFNVKAVTIKPAIITPKNINGKAFLNGTLKIKAQIEAVHTPVKGNGIATKITKANSLHCSNFLQCFFLFLSKSHKKKELNLLKCLLRYCEIGFNRQSKKIPGNILPKTEKRKAEQGDRL